MRVHRAFRFRLYPTPAQDAELREWERQLRWLYNLAHEQRLLGAARSREERPRVDYYRQGREMTELMRETHHDGLARVVCSARQEALRDLDRAWQRWRKGLGGRPHFKRRTDAVRIYLSTPRHWRVTQEKLALAGVAGSVGPLEIRQDRPWPSDATLSACHLVRDVDQWYAVFPLEYTETRKRPVGPAVGINRGAVHAIADSTGRVVDSPGYYAKAMGRIAKLSRDLDRKESGSRNAHKAAVKLARAHRKVRRQREWFLHDQSRHYADTHELIAIEDWSTKNMTGSEPDEKFKTRPVKRAINRAILDVGWYELGRQIRYKAEVTGAEVRAVPVFDPDCEKIGISSVCSVCGEALPRPASGRAMARCDVCEHSELGDINAARNVLVRAEAMGPETPKTPRASIKIKGRVKRSETTVNPTVEASGGDPLVRGPDEGGTGAREVPHHARTVVPTGHAGHPPPGATL